ncbi:MAG: hypothetical protein KatS3mg129_3127 [Leptospiraceae bacterium]|nr:MAG: hypothetical protein KatS3mg129_3127 [Leptospiraceae bacterium]
MGKFRNQSEEVIYQYLINKNYTILEHNKIIKDKEFRIEIDIIGFYNKNQTLHFIEVKNWNHFYIHPVIKEIYHRKEKLILSSKIFINHIINNKKYYKEKCEYNQLLCLLEKISPWELTVSFDLIWKKQNKIYHFKNILGKN